MTVSALPDGELHRRLTRSGLAFRCGPFHYRIRSPIPSIVRGLERLYADHPLIDDGVFVDFDLTIGTSPGLRRWIRPQARFYFEGASPFEPLPAGHAFPLLEWAMNWCISSLSLQYLILHAAVVERGGRAAILPAPPGSGKSTLCAALINRGWRLLSDELALISTSDLMIAPLCRPVSLKNESIALLRAFAPDAVFGDVTPDTIKGAVGHMKPPRSHVIRAAESAAARWVIFPQYVPGAAPTLTPRPRADGMMELGRNAFNYGALGRIGFETLGEIVDRSECYQFRYSALDDAVATFERLAESRAQCAAIC